MADLIVYLPAPSLGAYQRIVATARRLISGVESGTADITLLEQLGEDLDRLDSLIAVERSEMNAVKP